MTRIEELSWGLQESERQRDAGARSAMLGHEERAEADARGRRVEEELKDARLEVSALKSEVMNLRVEYQRVTSEREREGGRGDKMLKSKVKGLEERCRVLRDEADHGMYVYVYIYTHTRSLAPLFSSPCKQAANNRHWSTSRRPEHPSFHIDFFVFFIFNLPPCQSLQLLSASGHLH